LGAGAYRGRHSLPRGKTGNELSKLCEFVRPNFIEKGYPQLNFGGEKLNLEKNKKMNEVND